MTTTKKLVIAVIALSLALICAIGGTLAFLVATSNMVTNTFTYGEISLKLWENDYVLSSNSLDTSKKVTSEADYKMVPGNAMPKNPTVTVLKDSEACWLFVKIDESANFDNYMTYKIADGWTQDNGTDIPANVYYREVAATEADTDITILANNQVKVLDTVTKTMLNTATFTNPTLTFTAYAVQKDNVTSVADAWKLVGTKGVPANS